MGFASAFYNTFAKRNSVFVTSILVGSFAFGIGFDTGINSFFDYWNKGKQWKDIRHNYVQDEE